MAPLTTEELVIRHFDAHQQQGGDDEGRKGRVTDGSVEARVALLRQELEAASSLKHADNKKNTNDSLDDSDDDEEEEDDAIHQVTAAVLQCVDAAMACEISKDSQDSVERILELAACFVASYHDEDNKNGHAAQALVGRAIQFSAVIMERVRVQACKLLGLVVQYLMTTMDDGNETAGKEQWKHECIDAASRAIRSRLTDKSQAVRNAAITACASFFSSTILEEEMDTETLLESLLWNMAHDSSTANRIAALQSVPISQQSLDVIIDRVRDIKDKVRVEAFNILRTKATTSIHTLTSEQYAQLARLGLTDRYVIYIVVV